MKNGKNATSKTIRYVCHISQKYKAGSVMMLERQKRLTGNWYIPKWLLDILQDIIVKVFTLYHYNVSSHSAKITNKFYKQRNSK